MNNRSSEHTQPSSENLTNACCDSLSDMWTNPFIKRLPQYNYISLPAYKFFGGNQNPLISVPISFVVTDLVAHQFLANIVYYGSLASLGYNSSWGEIVEANLNPINFARMGMWMLSSLPLAYKKYKALHTATEAQVHESKDEAMVVIEIETLKSRMYHNDISLFSTETTTSIIQDPTQLNNTAKKSM